jgi:hypothetical protein
MPRGLTDGTNRATIAADTGAATPDMLEEQVVDKKAKTPKKPKQAKAKDAGKK